MFKKKVITTPAKPGAGAGLVRELTLDFSKLKASSMMTTEDHSAKDVVNKKSALCINPFVGLISREKLSVAPGETYRCEFEVRALADSKNGKPNNFFIGPIPRDKDGKVLDWWKPQAPLKMSEKIRKGSVDLKMPEAAASVHIGILGNWADPKPAGNGAIGLLRARLFKLP